MSRQRAAVVVGAGVAGLTSARELSKRGWKVALVSHKAPLDLATTSQGAGGFWMPFHIEPAVDSARWAATTLREYHAEKAANGPRAKFIYIRPAMCLKPERSAAEEIPTWSEIPEVKFAYLNRDEILRDPNFGPYLPPDAKAAFCFMAPVVHAEPYMESLVQELKQAGIKMSFGHQFDSLSAAHDFGSKLLGETADAVVNCTGLGANSICSNDQSVVPGRGVVVQATRPAGCEAVITSEIEPFTEDSPAYAIPRGADLITLGGTFQEGNYDLEFTDAEVENIKWKAKLLYPQFEKDLQIEKVWVGLRPVRHLGLRLEVEQLSGKPFKVLHNFGAGGAGWTVMYGCAAEGVDLLESSLGSVARSKL